jgi:protein-histidine pros-kinase
MGATLTRVGHLSALDLLGLAASSVHGPEGSARVSVSSGEPDAASGLQALVESAGIPTLVSDGDGRIAFWNHAIADLFGYEYKEFGTLRVRDLVPERLRAVHATHTMRYMAAPRFRAMGAGLVLGGRRRDGSEFPINISLGPLRYDDRPYVMATVQQHFDPAA